MVCVCVPHKSICVTYFDDFIGTCWQNLWDETVVDGFQIRRLEPSWKFIQRIYKKCFLECVLGVGFLGVRSGGIAVFVFKDVSVILKVPFKFLAELKTCPADKCFSVHINFNYPYQKQLLDKRVAMAIITSKPKLETKICCQSLGLSLPFPFTTWQLSSPCEKQTHTPFVPPLGKIS